jgi:hypothetical protein
MNDNHTSVLFPTSVSAAYSFQGQYEEADTLKQSVGYWLKFGSAQEIPLYGGEIYMDSAQVVAGWNLIGSISVPVPVDGIVSDPPGVVTSQFYGYDGGYAKRDTIMPGNGYWVKVDREGKLFLSSSAVPGEIQSVKIVETSELPPPPPEGDTANIQSRIPTEYGLGQNYPNPFNPTTTIKYQIPNASHVTIKIYDVLGREVATLVDGREEAGYKSVTWDARDVPSGIYFYRLIAGNYIQTRKLILVK